ncbi:MAG: DUF3107 domain-containing protein [Pseudonocardiales bacterium]|nr:MAG: DUF3107 domain-containing protein [Pseudonocardiales bacterium]
MAYPRVERVTASVREAAVEVKIGVQHSPRELVIESTETAQDVERAVAGALDAGAGGLLTLVDDKGRRVIVPAAKIAYVEIAETESRRVGFVAS